MFSKIKRKLYQLFLNIPIVDRYSQKWYKRLGVNLCEGARVYKDVKIRGDCSLVTLKKNAEVTNYCFLLAKDRIEIGENSTLAYQTTILTSANPNGPHNKLVKVYPAKNEPVIIGNNTWIGARATILPGVTIGNFCVVAAGSVVNRDVPDYSVVAGVPAKIVKTLDYKVFAD